MNIISHRHENFYGYKKVNVKLTDGFIYQLGLLFKTVSDPDPSLSPKEVLDMYSVNYPQLKSASLSEPNVIADRLVYSIELPPVKTKG